MTTVNDFDTFFEHFLIAALWSTTDENGDPYDSRYSITDLDPDCLQSLKAHALSFWLRCWHCLDHETPEWKTGTGVAARAGHDFWLTSQGHGAGFWDGDWPVYGDLLTKLAKCYPREMELVFRCEKECAR